MMPVICRVVLCFFLVSITTVAGEEWSRFRGPNGSGLGNATVPLTWTEKDFRWKVALDGTGHSSPVIHGSRIFVTAARSGERLVYCLDTRDGRTRWKRSFAGSAYRMHRRNSAATSTPAVDDDRLYLCWATPNECLVMALDHAGKTLWQIDLGPYKSQHGFGVSPIVHDGMVIVHYQPDGKGALVALDAKSGKVRWKTPRQGRNATYTTPCVRSVPNGKSELIFTNWQHGVTAVDPATGKIRWELSAFDTETQMRAIASPVMAGDLVIGVCGFITGKKELVAVRPGDPARGVKPSEVWRLERGVPQMATPLVKGNRVYLTTEQGIATCLDATTGKVIWQKRIPGTHYASPVCVGDRLYCTANEGKVVVLRAADTFEVLAENPLGETAQATPAIAGGQIVFRTNSQVIAIGSGKGGS